MRITGKGHHDDDGTVARTDDHLSLLFEAPTCLLLLLLEVPKSLSVLLTGVRGILVPRTGARGSLVPREGSSVPREGSSLIVPRTGANASCSCSRRQQDPNRRSFSRHNCLNKERKACRCLKQERERWLSVVATIPSSSWCPFLVNLGQGK
jgi:hypothetical protein